MHAKAWVDENLSSGCKPSPGQRKRKCDQCHAPQPILVTGVGKMPKTERQGTEKPVFSCLVCHLDAHGAMHGPPASAETYFHANVTNPVYTDPNSTL